MFARITALAAAVLVSSFAFAQQQQQLGSQPGASQTQPNHSPQPQCWDAHTNQVRVRTADSPGNQPDSTVGSAQRNAPMTSPNTAPGGAAQRPAGMANC